MTQADPLTALDRANVTTFAKNLTALGEPEAATLLQAATVLSQEPATVVVVGEVKRGKSTLVNALAGQAVSPTGNDVVTFCPVWLVPPTDTLPLGSGALSLADGTRTQPLPVEQVVARLTPMDDPPDPGQVPVGATVAIDQALIGGVHLVDTPGVGGLDAAHGRATLAALQGADAVLFVTDGGQPLTQPELDFLLAASDRVDTVVFALTKIDLTLHWDEVLEANRAALRRHAPRFADAPFHPVAAALAVDAWDQTAEDAEFLLSESRIADLAETLRRVGADGGRLRTANALRSGLNGMERATAKLTQQLAALDDPALVEALEADETRLREFRTRGRTATRFELPTAISRLRRTVVSELAEGSREAEQRLTAVLSSRSFSTVPAAEFHALLQDELTALAGRLRDLVVEGLTTITHEAFADLPQPEHLTGAGAEYRLEAKVVPGTRFTPGSGLDAVSTATSAFMLPRSAAWQGNFLASSLGAFASAAPLLGWFLVAAPFVVSLARKRVTSQQQQLVGDLRASLQGLRGETVEALDVVLEEFRPQLVMALEDTLQERIAELEKTIRAARQGTAAKDSTRRRLEEATRSLQLCRDELTAILARLDEPTNGRE